MSFFFDTNVCIGFIFKWDPWYEKAKEILMKKKSSYFSDTVKEECGKKFNILNKEYIKFLDNLEDKVTKSPKDIFMKNDLIYISSKIPVKKKHNGKDFINKKNNYLFYLGKSKLV